MGVKIDEKKMAIIILLLVTAISYASAEKFKASDQAVLSRAFGSSKSRLECFNTSYHGELNDKFLNQIELNEIGKKYIDLLEIKEIERDIIEETNINQISIYGQGDDGENITLILYSYLGEEKSATTIFVDISGNQDHKRLLDIGSKMTKILKKEKIKTSNTTCIIGSYRGKLKDKDKMGIVESLIKSTNSEEVESLIEDSVISHSLYSKDIDEYIYSGKNKMNLNIAIRYNEYSDETSILIASPIITVGY